MAAEARTKEFFKNEFMQLHFRLESSLKPGEEQPYKEGFADAATEILGVFVEAPEDDNDDDHNEA